MELQLKNIGMIKEANVAIDGLTVIAGENDTGKSTVSKALYVILKSLESLSKKEKDNDLSSFINYSAVLYYLLFKKDILPQDGLICVKNLFDGYTIGIKRDFIESEDEKMGMTHKPIVPYVSASRDLDEESIKKDILKIIYTNEDKKDIIFIETPLIWNFTDFFRDIAQVESQMQIQLDYPYLMKDLNFKLHIKSASKGLDIKEKVTALMGGEFKKDESDHYYFDKNGQRVELVNTATGIKYFGIFQVLSQNNYLNKDTVLILDEPEVHLHPKWQLEMAKIIVELVKSGVKIVVNSHSPYMIQALIKYARDEEIVNKTNFYLTEKVDNYANINNVNDELNKIFELLAEPMNQVFEL